MIRVLATTAVVAVAGVLGATWYLGQRSDANDPFAQCRSSQIAGGAETIGGPFELVNGAGKTVTETEVITQPSLIYFGYTFCPDVCPLDVSRNAEAVDVLDGGDARQSLVVAAVTKRVQVIRNEHAKLGALPAELHLGR